MNIKYHIKEKGDLVGKLKTLEITNPLIKKGRYRYFTAKCIKCHNEKDYRYCSLKSLVGCPSRCQNKDNFWNFETKYYKVLKPVKGKESYWECLCLCGRTFLRKSSAIKKGIIKGCCQKIENLKKRKKGTLERQLMGNYKATKNAKLYGFNLSEKQFSEIIKNNCYYCGSEPSREYKSKGCAGVLVCNGIDRKDNSKGYTVKNSLPCCKKCNFAKRNLPFSEFIAWLDRIKTYERKEISL